MSSINKVRAPAAWPLPSLVLWLLTFTITHAATDPLAIVPPLGLGPYAVGCSDVAQNLTPATGNLSDYWEGVPFDGNPHYVTQLLTEPADTVTYPVVLPNDSELYAGFAGQPVQFAAIVCYPTDPGNSRPDYPIPGESPVPKMQRAGEAPIWADPAKRYPVVVFSHGLGGSPLASEYLESMALFATHGYVVIAPFHADARISRIRIQDFSDVIYLFTHFSEVVSMQAIRPQALKGAIDTLLSHPHYRDHIDPNGIGGFGASLGGEAMVLLAGAKLTVSLGLSSKHVLTDQRIRAMVGYVPYSGQKVIPAFGDDENGTVGLRVPFMAIGGTADTTAPLYLTEQAVNNMNGTRYVISLPGVVHGLALENVPEVFTWAITFLDAHLKDAATVRTARTKLARMQQVTGGTDENVDVDVLVPDAPRAGETRVTEFYNSDLNHYFITPYTAEANGILLGAAGPGWERTEIDFNAWQDASSTGGPVCRFYGTPGRGPNSHFFTADADECAFVKKDPGWTFEGLTMRVIPATAGVCPTDTIPVFRVYNNRFLQNDSNHRYTTSRMTREQMKARGSLDEGTVFCVVP
jgi:dienelactone hydrolase